MKRNHLRRALTALLLTLALTGCAAVPQGSAGSAPASSVGSELTEPQPPEDTVATLAVCGDVMSHMPVTNDAWDETQNRYDYGRIMAGAAPWVAGADYAVANLETTLAGGPNYSGYPAFNSPDDLAWDLKALGFDLLLTANNHCLDKGYAGLSRTLDVLDEAGLAHVGTSRSAQEQTDGVVLADVGGISVAFLGWTYGTNGIPLPKDAPYAVNLFNRDYLTSLSQPDEEALLSALDRARALEPDLIAVMIHWGVEYQTTPNAYQRQMADFLLENGADLILGGHSHVPQPMEMRTVTGADGESRTGFVCYSLGNFISSQNDSLTDTTAVLTLELTRNNVTGECAVTDYTYEPMLMLDRESGADPRFELLDVGAVLTGGGWDQSVTDKAQKAREDCDAIFSAPVGP
jgi:poly-gamma-glutamate capsule biosynthesis protein CapA/YwtB (metallophosphatase superfamily)